MTTADAETEESIRDMFNKIAGDDLEVDPYELQNILNTVYMKGSLHVVMRAVL